MGRMGKRTVTLHELSAELPRVLEYARVDRDVHVSVSRGAAYIQFAFPAGWILDEAVSNHNLAEADALSEADAIVLDILGWQRPGVDRDGHDHRNFFREWHNDTPSKVIAEDVQRTLAGAYLHNRFGLVELEVFACAWCQEHDAADRAFGDATEAQAS
jgi:hypothetical protein